MTFPGADNKGGQHEIAASASFMGRLERIEQALFGGVQNGWIVGRLSLPMDMYDVAGGTVSMAAEAAQIAINDREINGPPFNPGKTKQLIIYTEDEFAFISVSTYDELIEGESVWTRQTVGDSGGEVIIPLIQNNYPANGVNPGNIVDGVVAGQLNFPVSDDINILLQQLKGESVSDCFPNLGRLNVATIREELTDLPTLYVDKLLSILTTIGEAAADGQGGGSASINIKKIVLARFGDVPPTSFAYDQVKYFNDNATIELDWNDVKDYSVIGITKFGGLNISSGIVINNVPFGEYARLTFVPLWPNVNGYSLPNNLSNWRVRGNVLSSQLANNFGQNNIVDIYVVGNRAFGNTFSSQGYSDFY
jgi:hypothetical protein